MVIPYYALGVAHVDEKICKEISCKKESEIIFDDKTEKIYTQE